MDVEKLLKEQQLKVTPQHKAIIKVLQNTNTVLNAQEILRKLSKHSRY